MNSPQLGHKRKLSVMIVDDEKLARDFLTRMLSKLEDIQEILACATVGEARERICQFRPEVLFLDIEMPGESGFQLLEALPPAKVPVVVFTTAHAQFASKAFDVQACDYLLKPFDEDRLFLALDRAKESLENHARSSRSPTRITVPLGNRAVRLAAHEIDCMSAEDNYVRIHCGKESLLVRSTLEKLERDLRDEMLLRVHRSTIVNIRCVKEIRRGYNHQYFLILRDERVVKCSRRYRRRIRAAFRL